MNRYLGLIGAGLLGFGCGGESFDQDFDRRGQDVLSYGFYGVRNDQGNRQRLCAQVPGTSQQCLLPANKQVRVRLNTTGMSSEDASRSQTWVTAIINNTFNSNEDYLETGFSWLQTIHQPKVTIVQGTVDNSVGDSSSDIRRYLRLTCNQVGAAMTENPAKNGTYHACNSWTANIDFAKLRTFDGSHMDQMTHHAIAISMLAPAGIGVSLVDPILVTYQNISRTSYASTGLTERDYCAMRIYDPTDLSNVNFSTQCNQP